jgi:hypothetical protein
MTPKFKPPWIATDEELPEIDEPVLAILRRHRNKPVNAVIDEIEGWMLAETPMHKAYRLTETPIAWMPIPRLMETK